MSKIIKTIENVKLFEEVEEIYSYIREEERYKDKKIEIRYIFEEKSYKIDIYDEIETEEEKEIDINVDLEVVYGDSVTGDTPLLLKNKGKMEIRMIEEIFNEKEKKDSPTEYVRTSTKFESLHTTRNSIHNRYLPCRS